jgi:hypothetical protein
MTQNIFTPKNPTEKAAARISQQYLAISFAAPVSSEQEEQTRQRAPGSKSPQKRPPGRPEQRRITPADHPFIPPPPS